MTLAYRREHGTAPARNRAVTFAGSITTRWQEFVLTLQ